MSLFPRLLPSWQECVPSLHFCTLVPPRRQGRRAVGEEAACFWTNSLLQKKGITLANLGSLRQSHKAKQGIYLTASKSLSFADIKDQYGMFLPQTGLRESYDVFLSYRWGRRDQVRA